MFAPRISSVLLLAAFLPAASGSKLQGAIEAEVNADTECAADDCGGAMSLLQVGQRPAQKSAEAEVVAAVADVPDVEYNGTGARAATDELQGMSMVDESSTASQTCYDFTGYTCYTEDCQGERNAVCRNQHCVCEASCAGSDGKCYVGQTNVQVAASFTLTNVKWPKYSMYFQQVSATGQLKTTDAYSILNLGTDKFSLFKLPGNTSKFFLGSVAYPTKVARIAATAGTAVSLFGLYSTDVSQGFSPDRLALSVCYDHAKAALMFGSYSGTWWAFIHHGSWLVYATPAEKSSLASVGDGGLWTPSPPFDQSQIAMLPKC